MCISLKQNLNKIKTPNLTRKRWNFKYFVNPYNLQWLVFQLLHGVLVWNDLLVLVDHMNSYNNTGLILSVLACNFNIISIKDFF